MGVIVNQRSFKTTMDNEYIAKDKYRQLVLLIKMLEDQFEIGINRFESFRWDQFEEVIPGYSLKKFLNLLGVEEKRVVLALLNNTGTVNRVDEVYTDYPEAFYAYACKGVLLSVESSEDYSGDSVDFHVDSKVYQAKNMSKNTHIRKHADFIPARKYEANPKHKMESYTRNKGVRVAPMDLDDVTAQHVLNFSIWLDSRLFGVYNDMIYEFKRTHGYVYHGYRNDYLTEDMRKKVVSLWGKHNQINLENLDT